MNRADVYEQALLRAIETHGPGENFTSQEAYDAWAGPFWADVKATMDEFDRRPKADTGIMRGYKRSHLGQ